MIIIFLELLTLIAFSILGSRVDLVLLRSGDCGLLDTTNVVTGEIAVVTSIGLDLSRALGDGLEKIAEQKAGIFRLEEGGHYQRLTPEAELVSK